MSHVTTYFLKPAPALAIHQARTKVKLCPFPKSQARGQKRYLHPDGEAVVCRTGEERRWWISMKRSGGCVDGDEKKIEAAAKARAEAKEDYAKAKAAAQKAVKAAQSDESKAQAEKALAGLKKPVASVPWSGPPPIDKGHENVPKLTERDPSKGGRKGGK